MTSPLNLLPDMNLPKDIRVIEELEIFKLISKAQSENKNRCTISYENGRKGRLFNNTITKLQNKGYIVEYKEIINPFTEISWYTIKN
jgi:hypothetical protein